MDSWITRQMGHTVSQFDASIEIHYQDSAHYFRNPDDFYYGITQLWNYLDAVKLVDWEQYLKPNSTLLDLAGGTGWLSAYLSKFDQVAKIFNVDASKYFLTVMMPGLVRLMNGKPDKIAAIEGIFSPLFFEDASLDMVVISSSLHHADSIERVLKEIHRVLKKDGLLFILNETPYSNMLYIRCLIRQFLIMMKNTVVHNYITVSPHISSSGYLYDPILGDKTYPAWYWKKAIAGGQFILFKEQDTYLFTVKAHKKGIHLVNFLCRKM